jgi:hypothetical protein
VEVKEDSICQLGYFQTLRIGENNNEDEEFWLNARNLLYWAYFPDLCFNVQGKLSDHSAAFLTELERFHLKSGMISLFPAGRLPALFCCCTGEYEGSVRLIHSILILVPWQVITIRGTLLILRGHFHHPKVHFWNASIVTFPQCCCSGHNVLQDNIAMVLHRHDSVAFFNITSYCNAGSSLIHDEICVFLPGSSMRCHQIWKPRSFFVIW